MQIYPVRHISILASARRARKAVRMSESVGRLLRIRDVVVETSLSKATIYRMIGRGEFPSPVRVSTQRVAWSDAAVQGWKKEQLLGPPI